MSELAGVLRTWLMRAPRPAQLRVYARDGREFDIAIPQGAAWVDTAISVAALEPERIEAQTQEGKLIRATVVADLIKKEEAAAVTQSATFTAMHSTDPETQRMLAFAEMISRAHERATDAIQATVGVAFTQLQEICSSLAAQATAAQQSANELSVAIRNLMLEHASEALERAEEKTETTPLEAMAQNFLAGQQMAQAEHSAPKPTNGKH